MDHNMNDTEPIVRAESCWTCRLRRKKCDMTTPVCDVCSSLLITCHYFTDKPEWADGGEKQQQMIQRIKQEVKDQAPHRRSLAYAKTLEDAVPQGHASSDSKKESPIDNSLSNDKQQHAPGSTTLDRGFLVCYLEFYFPFMFPFYQPSMLDRGRTWVIDLITNNKAMEQTTLSLSSYFFSMGLETKPPDAKHEACKQTAWERLLCQTHETFRILQGQLGSLALQSTSERLCAAVQTIGCIVLLQRFETAIGSFENCQTHLDAAIELFDMIATSDNHSSVPPFNFEQVYQQLRGHGPSWPSQFRTFYAPSSEQMAFSFFSTLLLVDDIVASTATGEEPRLYQYHGHILGQGEWPFDHKSSAKPCVSLETVMGCQNWAMVAIARISALNTWKKRQRAAGDLDMIELVQRASAIKSMLTTNLTCINMTTSWDPAGVSSPWDIQTPCNGHKSALATQSSIVTRLWAHAAILYLAVVVSGWQPSSCEIRYHTSCVLDLLAQHSLSWPALRTVAWPYCIAGCLVEVEQQSAMRGIIDGLQPPSLLGPLRKALEVMENVWARRDSLDASWDFEACFHVLGHAVLLL